MIWNIMRDLVKNTTRIKRHCLVSTYKPHAFLCVGAAKILFRCSGCTFFYFFSLACFSLSFPSWCPDCVQDDCPNRPGSRSPQISRQTWAADQTSLTTLDPQQATDPLLPHVSYASPSSSCPGETLRLHLWETLKKKQKNSSFLTALI